MAVCFTGHRTLNYKYIDTDVWPNLTEPWLYVWEPLTRIIAQLSYKGHTTFISGGALGFDMLAALGVIALKRTGMSLKLTIALPFDGHNSNWKSKSSVSLMNGILTAADNIVYVSSPPYAAWKMQVRNQWMVDNSTEHVALHKPGSSGGTLNCINSILKTRHTLYVINADTYQIEKREWSTGNNSYVITQIPPGGMI